MAAGKSFLNAKDAKENAKFAKKNQRQKIFARLSGLETRHE
jgi:hypothetical protein